MTMFQRVQNDRLSDRIVTQLIQMIHAGELPVGSKLPPETQLALEFGVSRGILREALNILRAKGYITRSPRGGTLISQASDSNIGNSITTQVKTAAYRDLLEFREAMECKVVQKVVELATDAEIAQLFDLVEQADVSPPAAPGSIDYYFHYRLAQLSRNSLFVVFLDMYYDTINEITRKSYEEPKRQSQAKREHLRIATAIQNRNARAAVAAMRAHLSHVRSQVASRAGE